MDYTRLTNLEVTGDLKAGTFTGALTGNVTGNVTGGIIGAAAISKSVDYALSAAEKANLVIFITMTAASKVVTLGLAAGQVAFVHNIGSTNAFTVKNVAEDAGTSLEAGKTLLFVGATTEDSSVVVELN